MSFILISILSLLTSTIIIRVGTPWLSVVPLFFMILYSIDTFGQLSFKGVSRHFTRAHGAILSWTCMMVGAALLIQSQGGERYYSSISLILINIILLIVSYHSHYKEGQIVFFWGGIIARCATLGQGIYYQLTHHEILALATGGLIQLIIIRHFLIRYYALSEEDNHLSLCKEIAYYLLIYVSIYRWIGTSYNASVVLSLLVTTALMMLRQQFLSYQQHLKQEKTESLTARALLQGQKVLHRYAEKKDRFYTSMERIMTHNLVPSATGLRFLQIAQGSFIISLIIISIRSLRTSYDSSIAWYRAGVLCFVISLFAIDRQDIFFGRYKKFGLVIVSGAFYLTLFSQTAITSDFVIGSLAWNCVNMFFCLFYDTIIPLSKRIFNRHDLIFWMMISNSSAVITLLSLGSLPLSGDSIFAIGCMIVGLVSFFSYHIWKKYSKI